jgi:hypothetical protein
MLVAQVMCSIALFAPHRDFTGEQPFVSKMMGSLSFQTVAW